MKSRYLLPTLGLLVSCGVNRPSPEPLAIDSVAVRIVPREVIIRDTILVELPAAAPQESIRPDSSILENPYARSRAAILASGELYHSLESRSTELSLPTEHRIEVRDSIIYRERTIRQEVEKELTPWQEFRINGFYLLLLLLLFLIRR